MQSAFVDIGLERDAFLYVSDFMEVEDQDDVEEVPTNRVPAPEQRYQPQTHPEPEAGHSPAAVRAIEEPEEAEAHPEAVAVPQESGEPAEEGSGRDRDRGGWHGRRRRRGRRGERMPETRFARPEPQAPAKAERSEYGPPPGYQPIILPGESISKYQRLNHVQPQTEERRPTSIDQNVQEQIGSVTSTFPEDEPLFAANRGEEREASEPRPAFAESAQKTDETASERERDREDERLDESDVAALHEAEGSLQAHEAAEQEHAPGDHDGQVNYSARPGTMEEEEIEEDEADLGQYVEELEDDAVFEELEEETHAADEYQQRHEIAASGEPPIEITQSESTPISDTSGEDHISDEMAEEVADEEEEEAEIETAQAEAEALLDAEARGNGTVDARVEVRGPAPTAGYTQRGTRPAFDRRGRGRRGGKKFQRRREPQALPQITDLLKEGQEILVQIAKEPIGKKGARITSHIALPGRFLVYMPTVNHTGVSRKISSEEERQRLKRIILSERDNGHGGFIVRTAAQGASEEELRADIRFLKGLWAEIRSRADNGKAPALIYHDLNVVERVLRDQVTSDFSAIWVDNEQEYERILRFANRFQPALVRRVKLYTKETPLFEQFGLKEEIDKALKSKVWLKSGGYIVINQTEALVAIDVNTGKYVGKTARLEDTIVKTNVDAIKEIVRQIRLRDLGGIIVIDFIDMDERRNRQKVMQALEEALRSDRSPSKVLQFNDFGLVAITRKRVKQSLERTIGASCPYCTGTGFVKSVNTVCDEIYVEMRKISKHLEHSDVMLRVNPEVAKVLKANNGRALNEMEELVKKTIIVKSDPALHQEQFDIN